MGYILQISPGLRWLKISPKRKVATEGFSKIILRIKVTENRNFMTKFIIYAYKEEKE